MTEVGHALAPCSDLPPLVSLQFKTFDLTPSGKKAVRHRKEEGEMREKRERDQARGGGRAVQKGRVEGECEGRGKDSVKDRPEIPHLEEENKKTETQFETRPDCLQAILNHQPIQLQVLSELEDHIHVLLPPLFVPT